MPKIEPLSSEAQKLLVSVAHDKNTKDLIQAGITGDQKFIDLLKKYKFANILDINMAAMIICMFVYAAKNSAITSPINLNKIIDNGSLEKLLQEGDGKEISNDSAFKQMLIDVIVNRNAANNFLTRTARIKPWSIVNKLKIRKLKRVLTALTTTQFNATHKSNQKSEDKSIIKSDKSNHTDKQSNNKTTFTLLTDQNQLNKYEECKFINYVCPSIINPGDNVQTKAIAVKKEKTI